MNRTLGQKMRLLRDKKHYTQEQISSLLHVGRSSYANYEIDRREPSIDFLVALARFHHVSVDYLVTNTYNLTHAQHQELLQLLAVFRKLTPDNQSDVFDYMKYRLQKQMKENKS